MRPLGEVTTEHCPTGQMRTDISTKPKQGVVYRVFMGHMMGIPADYKDSNYAGKVPVSPAVSMLPLTKEQLVGGIRLSDRICPYFHDLAELVSWSNTFLLL